MPTPDLALDDVAEVFHEMRDLQGLPSLRQVFRYCPQVPLPRQLDFLDLTCEEALYAGEAGGGKSSALGMAAMMYTDCPEYKALLLRPNVVDFFKSTGLGTRMQVWFQHTDVRFSATDNMFIWPNGSTIEFGHVRTKGDLERYRSQEFSFIGWEELTTFNLPPDPEQLNAYTYLFRSLRHAKHLNIPRRMRSVTNPGGPGHLFTKRRFVTDEMMKEIRRGPSPKVYHHMGRAYVHCFAEENEHVDMPSYRSGLDHLDTVTRARQKYGDWEIQEHSEIMPGQFRYYRDDGHEIQLLKADRESVLATFLRADCSIFITVDAAGTSKDKADQQKGRKSSYSSVGAWMSAPSSVGKFLLCVHVERKRLSIPELTELLVDLNREYRPARILVENEKFGQSVTQMLENQLPIKTVSTRGKDKKTRAVPLLNAFGRGKVYFPTVEPDWFRAYLEELTTWTGMQNEVTDQLDMSAYAAMEVFVAQPPRWKPNYFGATSRYLEPPTNCDRVGVGVVPSDGVHASAIVVVSRAKDDGEGRLWVDGWVDKASPETTLSNTRKVYDLAARKQPWCVLVDNEFKGLLRSKLPALRGDGLGAECKTKIVPEAEACADYLDSGIRDEVFRYATSDGGNAIVSRLASYPDSVEDNTLKALWLAVRALG